jgi:hypothetical protein
VLASATSYQLPATSSRFQFLFLVSFFQLPAGSRKLEAGS